MAAKKYVCKICGYVHEGSSAPDACPLCKAGADQFDVVADNAKGDAKEAPKKKGLNTNSDTYAILYAAVVVIIVAFMLAAVSSALKSMQDKNIELDKKKQILASLNIKSDNAEDKYKEVIGENDAIINSKGEIVAKSGGFDVKNDKITADSDSLPIYICNVDGQEKYVIPMIGQGLWGGIWGYMAVNSDGNTIYGTYFSHSSETPGLGAEIASEKFTRRFTNKELLNDGNVALTVKKGAAADSNIEVNAISGATITCNGVDAMLKKYLEIYKSFLIKQQQQTEAFVELIPAMEIADEAAVTGDNVTE